MQEKDEYHFKILLVGDSRVGKSVLLQKFVRSPEPDFYSPTFGVDQKIAYFNLNGDHIKLRVWDAGGAPQIWNLLGGYITTADSIFICFDATNRNSLENVKTHVEKINQAKKNASVYLISCKAESKHRVVSDEDATKMAEKLGLTYIEPSSHKEIEEATKIAEKLELTDIETSSHKVINVRTPFLEATKKMYFLAQFNKIKLMMKEHFINYLKISVAPNTKGLFTPTSNRKEHLLREEYQINFGSLSPTPNALELEVFFKKTLDIIDRADALYEEENRLLSVVTTSPLSKTLNKILLELGKLPKNCADFSHLGASAPSNSVLNF